MIMTTIDRSRLAIASCALAATLALAGCGAPGGLAATPAPQPSAVATVPAAAPTNAPQPTSAAPTPVATQPSQADSATVAVQTVLDYYAAINDKKFADAYGMWASNGAASGQTLAQFEAGFANTMSVRLRLGTPAPAATGAIDVPVTLIAISNDPNPQLPQHVQQFQGSYTVHVGANGAQLASATIGAATNAPLPPSAWSDPATLLQGYYELINRHELAGAYSFWGNNGANSNQSFAQFAQGYVNTRQVAIELGAGQAGGAAGSIYTDIPALIVATQADGSQQAFCGTYTLRRLNVPPFDQLGWRIESATIAPTAPVQLGSDQAKQLLAGGCK